jgi:hypothetical protein
MAPQGSQNGHKTVIALKGEIAPCLKFFFPSVQTFAKRDLSNARDLGGKVTRCTVKLLQ